MFGTIVGVDATPACPARLRNAHRPSAGLNWDEEVPVRVSPSELPRFAVRQEKADAGGRHVPVRPPVNATGDRSHLWRMREITLNLRDNFRDPSARLAVAASVESHAAFLSVREDDCVLTHGQDTAC
jgi:hypothetical protein